MTTLSGFKPFKGRSIERGQFVKVYRNLHKQGEDGAPIYSIKCAISGIVLGHAESVELHNARFSVSEAGRQRVLKERQKNIHAYVIGAYAGAGEAQANRARYNPYKGETFVTEYSEPIYAAMVAHVGAQGVTYSIRQWVE